MNLIRPLTLVALGSVLAACPSSQQQPVQEPAKARPTYDAVPLIPREVLFGNPEKATPKLSPDGQKLAYLAPDEGVLNIWVRTVGAEDDKVVTHDRVRGIRMYFWAPDSQHLLYVQDQGGDENWHVYSVPLQDPSQARDLTPYPKVQAQILAVEPDHPRHILVGLNDRDPRLHDVYKLDLLTGERTLVQENDIGAISWVADHDMNVRVGQVLTPDGGATLMHRPAPQSPWQELVKWGAEDMFTSAPLAFAGDNRSLYLLSSAGGNTVELRSLDVTTGAQTTIAGDPTADVSEVMIHPRTHQVEAVAFTRARKEWQAVDPALREHFDAIAGIHAGDVIIGSRDDENRTWLLAFLEDKGPVAYYAYERASKQATFLFHHQPALADLPLAEMKPISYQARDGLTIHGYLSTPVGVEAKDLPAVVLVHGGPWHRDTWGYNGLVQLFTNRGYAVLQPNFRGSTGYGKQFVNAGDHEWGGKMQDDITDGTLWLVEQGIADKERICIAGGSYGGYATLMGLAKEPDLYACGVDIVGVANLITWMKTIPPYWKPFEHVLYQRVGNPETEAEFLRSRSPVFLADRIKAPLLIGQGANDPRVPRDESVQIRDALKKNDREVEYVEYADEGHGFARPENRLDFFAKAEAFLAKHLGGRAE